jgi:hypothetical protein
VYKIIQQTEKGNATFLNVAFQFVCPERDLPQGSYIIASQKFIEKTISKFLTEELGRSGPFKASECAGFIRQHGLHELFRRLITNPDGIAANWSFNRLIGASRQFHILRPIRIDTDELEFAISKFLQVLSLCGLKPVSADDLRERTRQEGKGLVSCSCKLYLAHAWCHHSCAIAFARKVITSWPPTMNPKPTIQAKSGRPPNAVRGGSLGFT